MIPKIRAINLPDLRAQLDGDQNLRARLQAEGGEVRLCSRTYQVSVHPPRTDYINTLGQICQSETSQAIHRAIFTPAAAQPMAPATSMPAPATSTPATATSTPAAPTSARPAPSTSSASGRQRRLPGRPTGVLARWRQTMAAQAGTETGTSQGTDTETPQSPVLPPSPAPAPTPAPMVPAAPDPTAPESAPPPAPMDSAVEIPRPATPTGSPAPSTGFPAEGVSRPGLPNPSQSLCYINSVVQTITQPWCATGVTDRLLTEPATGRHSQSQQNLRWGLGRLLQGLDNCATNIPLLRTRFLNALAVYAHETHHQQLKQMLPLTKHGVLAERGLKEEDPVDFLQMLVECVGLDNDPTVCSQMSTVTRTVQFAAGTMVDVCEPEIDVNRDRQLMLPVLRPMPILEESVATLSQETDRTTGDPTFLRLPVLTEGDILLTERRIITSPPPEVLTVALPIDIGAREVTRPSLVNLPANRRIIVPVTDANGRISREIYEVTSMVCAVPMTVSTHYLALVHTEDGFKVCSDEDVMGLEEYQYAAMTEEARALQAEFGSPIEGTLGSFFETTAYAPQLLTLRRVTPESDA